MKKYLKRTKGFTLIEMMIVIAIICLITIGSIASFGSYSKSKTLSTGVSEFSNFLTTAKSRAISQVKPSVCPSEVLEGYKVIITTSTEYELDVVCGGSSFTISKKKLPDQISFAAGSAGSIKFEVATGIVISPGVIRISGFGNTAIITVEKIGKILITDSPLVTPVRLAIMPASANISPSTSKLAPASIIRVGFHPLFAYYISADIINPTEESSIVDFVIHS